LHNDRAGALRASALHEPELNGSVCRHQCTPGSQKARNWVLFSSDAVKVSRVVTAVQKRHGRDDLCRANQGTAPLCSTEVHSSDLETTLFLAQTPSLTPQKGGSDGLRLVRLQQGGAAVAPATGMVSGGDIHTALLLTCMGACGTALGGLIVVAQARLVYVLDDGVVTAWRPLCTRQMTSTSTLTC